MFYCCHNFVSSSKESVPGEVEEVVVGIIIGILIGVGKVLWWYVCDTAFYGSCVEWWRWLCACNSLVLC